MHQLPPLPLASNPDITITLREATVREMMDFSGIATGHEEEATTLFLNTIQDKATFYDSKKWTADDRRLGLYWYWLHTSEDGHPQLDYSYDCKHCGKRHSVSVPGGELAQSYKSMKGKAERDLAIEGLEYKIVARPLTGEAMEELEAGHLLLEHIAADKEKGEGSTEYNKQETALMLNRLMHTFEFTDDTETDPKKRQENKENRLLNLTATQWRKLTAAIGKALIDMEHGLPSTYVDGVLSLIMPVHKCPNSKGGKKETQVSLPFRTFDYLPVIQ